MNNDAPCELDGTWSWQRHHTDFVTAVKSMYNICHLTWTSDNTSYTTLKLFIKKLKSVHLRNKEHSIGSLLLVMFSPLACNQRVNSIVFKTAYYNTGCNWLKQSCVERQNHIQTACLDQQNNSHLLVDSLGDQNHSPPATLNLICATSKGKI